MNDMYAGKSPMEGGDHDVEHDSESLTLKELSEELRMYAGRPEGIHVDPSAFLVWADAIDFHLSQPQPVAQGGAVAWQKRVYLAPDRQDKGGWTEWFGCSQGFAETVLKHQPNGRYQDVELRQLYATPTIPTGHRVVPEQPLEAADERAAFERWVRSHFKYPNLDIDTRYPGYYADKMTAGAWEAWQERAASPSAGGV